MVSRPAWPQVSGGGALSVNSYETPRIAVRSGTRRARPACALYPPSLPRSSLMPERHDDGPASSQSSASSEF